MEIAAVIIFLLVYLGMILGFWPGLALDRTGIALLGAIAFIELQGINISKATSYIDLSALTILFSFMIISAQFFYSGFYTHIIERMENWNGSPSRLLIVVILISATLSAVLINDIVCLALTPLIVKVCFHKKFNPIPFLIALACSSNIGSALTLIGNPQNILIGQVLHIPFNHHIKLSLIPCILGLVVTWFVIKIQMKGNWFDKGKEINPQTIPFNYWQSTKGIIVITAILIIFIFSDLPRDQVSLVGAGFLLLSRRMASQTMLSFIDWQLLVLFIGLFIVNRSFLHIINVNAIPQFLERYHIDISAPITVVLVSAILSNIVSNVPAVMLLLPFIKSSNEGSLLALSSTFAGNLFIVGSIANLIVISQASQFDVKIDWKQYAKIGFPVTIISFVIILAWLFLIKSI